MPRTIVFDELLLIVRAPENLPAARARAVRRALAGARFRNRLRIAVRTILAAEHVLSRAGVVVRLDR